MSYHELSVEERAIIQIGQALLIGGRHAALPVPRFMPDLTRRNHQARCTGYATLLSQ